MVDSMSLTSKNTQLEHSFFFFNYTSLTKAQLGQKSSCTPGSTKPIYSPLHRVSLRCYFGVMGLQKQEKQDRMQWEREGWTDGWTDGWMEG